MTSRDALIHDLTADLRPVRRRRPSREVALLLALGAAELAMLLGVGAMRPDMRHVIASPFMLWKLGSLLLLAAAGCALALRSFSPLARPRGGARAMAGLAVALVLTGLLIGPVGEHGGTLLARLDPVHGMLCAASIIVLALPMVAMLGALMRRAAPTRPEGSALASGLAAGACSAFIFAFCCRVNDPLYVIVWYSLACAGVTGLSRWLLPRRFRL